MQSSSILGLQQAGQRPPTKTNQHRKLPQSCSPALCRRLRRCTPARPYLNLAVSRRRGEAAAKGEGLGGEGCRGACRRSTLGRSSGPSKWWACADASPSTGTKDPAVPPATEPTASSRVCACPTRPPASQTPILRPCATLDSNIRTQDGSHHPRAPQALHQACFSVVRETWRPYLGSTGSSLIVAVDR